jgi:hypothetical protein
VIGKTAALAVAANGGARRRLFTEGWDRSHCSGK